MEHRGRAALQGRVSFVKLIWALAPVNILASSNRIFAAYSVMPRFLLSFSGSELEVGAFGLEPMQEQTRRINTHDEIPRPRSSHQRRAATTDHTASTMPKGHAP